MPTPSTLHAAEDSDESSRLHLLVMGPSTFAALELPASGVITLGRDEHESVAIRLADPLASRRHAQLEVRGHEVFITDLGSANGTRVRGSTIPPQSPTAVALGEEIAIGSTVLIVRRHALAAPPFHIGEHEDLEERLRAECARAREGGPRPSIMHLRVESATPSELESDAVGEAARQMLGPADVLASYLDHEYELLLVGAAEQKATELLQELLADLARRGVSARGGLASFPEDGRTADRLLQSASKRARGEGSTDPAPGHREGPVVAEDESMQRVLEMARKAAAANASLLILGETGVGKNVVAEAIHRLSPRASGPFVAQNSGAIPEALMESELFGHEKGAFSGAAGSKPGLFELARGGTFFLDEIGELPLAMQVKLLHALQSRSIRRVGGLRDIAIDLRFIAATNRDLEADVREGRFREDLFYRINVLSLRIPPLRERVRDIAPLARAFLVQMSRRDRLAREPRITGDAMAALEAYNWPGNVRQLENTLERAVAFGDGVQITLDDLPENVLRGQDDSAEPSLSTHVGDVAHSERERIVAALAACHGNQSRAAKQLGVGRIKLNRLMVKNGIPRLRDG